MKFYIKKIAYFFLFFFATTSCSSGKTLTNPQIDKELKTLPYDATFVLYNGKDFIISNKERASKPFGPASTFKIVNSLIALHTNTISSVNEVFFRYKGEQLFLKSWEHDMNLREAMRVSNLYAYQQIARRIGFKNMQENIFKLHYGNEFIGNSVDNFWINGSLKISAIEQVKFLIKLAKNELPYSKDIQNSVKDILLLEKNNNTKLYGKTGLLEQYNQETKSYIGWFVGFVEKNNRIYSFALNMDIPSFDRKLLELRVDLSKKILQVLDVL